jgi:retrograde regulation protein 2
MDSKQQEPEHLRAIVDMGSNGIRFSISSLQPPTARIMPTLYQHRVGISLYDAQYSESGERQPIDDKTVNNVTAAFRQFKRTCKDFRMSEQHVTVLATEATRTATNSAEFRQRIKDAVGWEVTLKSKEAEGEVGALGIASSLPEVNGIVMDLGGGSTQLSWIISSQHNATVRMPKNGAVSMPYGAAAMSRRLAEAEKTGRTGDLRHEIQTAMKDAYERVDIPGELIEHAKQNGGFTLYLSGGGFRGWGYLLMSSHNVRPYPIPVINGFKASRSQFIDTEDVKAAASATLQNEDNEVFRVSDRRASQVPAVAFLINALAETLPEIKEVRFCQGGVREGFLFKSLPAEIQSQHPLVIATSPFSTSPGELTMHLLQAAFPPGSTANAEDDFKSVFDSDLLLSFANLMNFHASHSKDLQASAALRSTTSGILAGVHGVLHESRTVLALLLCARWGDEVPPTDADFKSRLEKLVESRWTLWWVKYLGTVAALIGAVCPAGVSEVSKGRLALHAKWERDEKNRPLLLLTVALHGADREMFEKEIHSVEKVGKRKNWIGGREGTGHRVEVAVERSPD